MRVIVITAEPFFGNFISIVNKELDIAAIVMPLNELFQNVKANFSDGQTFNIYSYVYLQECLENYYYDYIVLAIPPNNPMESNILDDLKKFNVDSKKIFRAGIIYAHGAHLFVNLMNYVKPNISDYKVLITGISYAQAGSDISCYKMSALKCTNPSQDLYYDYKFAEKLINMENSDFKYAVIGIAPYSFHYDASYPGGGGQQFFILAYYLIFGDTHHYGTDGRAMKQIFNEDFLHSRNLQPPDTNFNFNAQMATYGAGSSLTDISELVKVRPRAEHWKDKFYPETLEENKQIFAKYMELCMAHDVTPIVTVFPFHKICREFFPKKTYDQFLSIIAEFKTKYDFHFIDKFNFDNVMQSEDFIDVDHLNASGAKKMSSYLNDYIMNLENNSN